MGALLMSLLTLLCGASITLLLFGTDSLLHNLPGLVKIIQSLVNSVNKSFYSLYRFVLNLAAFWLGLDINQSLPRVIATAILSGVFWALALWAAGFGLEIWLIALSLLHGAYIGWVWEGFEMPEGLWMGKER